MATNAVVKHDTNTRYGWQTPALPLTRTALLRSNFKIPVLPQLDKVANELLLSLPKDVFLELQPEMKVVNFERGAVIYDIGDNFDYVYFPNTLVASRLAIMEDGAMIEVGVVGREGLLGVAALIGANTANNMTIAETGGTAIRLRAKTLRDAFRGNPKLQNVILSYYHDFLTQISQRAACRCRHSVAQQLCTWLLQIHDRAATNDLILTQETIAHRLGARRASITVAINDLEKFGYLSCKRGHIIVSQRGGLEKLACECYGLLSCGFDSHLQSNLIE